MAPANTGRDNNNKKTVTKIDQTKSLILSNLILKERTLIIVDKKLIAPKIELRPATCKPKITKSTLEPI